MYMVKFKSTKIINLEIIQFKKYIVTKLKVKKTINKYDKLETISGKVDIITKVKSKWFKIYKWIIKKVEW